jgi:hypothetical protein
VLLGMGAGAVCPWLALETARALSRRSRAKPIRCTRSNLGLAKVMSKMGISVVDSYRGAHLFDAIGLADEVIAKCFAGTPSPLSGIGFADVEKQVRQSWRSLPSPNPLILRILKPPDGGTLVLPPPSRRARSCGERPARLRFRPLPQSR